MTFETLKDLASHLKSLGAEEVYLYGSVAKSKARPASDVDIFIFAPDNVLEQVDHLYGMDYPRVFAENQYRYAQIFSNRIVTVPLTQEEFKRIQPEAIRLDD